MKIISSKVHAILDHLMGALMIASPWIFGFADLRVAMLIPMMLGASVIGLALITDNELGVLPMISMSGHLAVDLLSGSFLAISPWLFSFSDQLFLPHLLFGLAAIGSVLMTIRKGAPEQIT